MDRRALLLGAGPALLAAPAAALGLAEGLAGVAPAGVAPVPAVPVLPTPVLRKPILPAPRVAPEQRIAAAMAEIRAALGELYPGHHLTGTLGLGAGTGGLALGAHPLRDYGARFFFDDDAPAPADRLDPAG